MKGWVNVYERGAKTVLKFPLDEHIGKQKMGVVKRLLMRNNGSIFWFGGVPSIFEHWVKSALFIYLSSPMMEEKTLALPGWQSLCVWPLLTVQKPQNRPWQVNATILKLRGPGTVMWLGLVKKNSFKQRHFRIKKEKVSKSWFTRSFYSNKLLYEPKVIFQHLYLESVTARVRENIF